MQVCMTSALNEFYWFVFLINRRYFKVEIRYLNAVRGLLGSFKGFVWLNKQKII